MSPEAQASGLEDYARHLTQWERKTTLTAEGADRGERQRRPRPSGLCRAARKTTFAGGENQDYGEPSVGPKKAIAILIVASCVGSCGTAAVQTGTVAMPAGVQVPRKS